MNLEKVKACILLGVNINSVCDNDEAETPVLFLACHNLMLLELLLAQPNIDVNVKLKSGTSILIYASDFDEFGPEVMRRLCRVPGIDLN